MQAPSYNAQRGREFPFQILTGVWWWCLQILVILIAARWYLDLVVVIYNALRGDQRGASFPVPRCHLYIVSDEVESLARFYIGLFVFLIVDF